MSNIQVETPNEPVDGLEELVKHVELNSDADTQTHLQRVVPAPPSVAAAAPPAPETGTGLLQVNRPVVLLGKDAAASTSLGSGRLQSRVKVLAAICSSLAKCVLGTDRLLASAEIGCAGRNEKGHAFRRHEAVYGWWS